MKLSYLIIIIILLTAGQLVFTAQTISEEKQYYKSSLNKIGLSAEEERWLKEHHTLRVGVGIAWPPFQYMENGEFKGLASDYISMVSERLGIHMQIIKDVSSFQQVLEMAKRREIDVLGCVSETPDRKEYMNFTQKYLSIPVVIITQKDTGFIGGLVDLNQKKVSFTKSLADHSRVKDNFPGIIPYFVKTPPEKFEAVSQGKAVACIENLATASYLIQKNNLANLKVAASSGLPNTELSFAVRNDWPLLCNIFNKALASITKEEHDSIYNKWIPVRFEYKADWSEILKWLILTGSCFIIILGISLFWNRKLAKEISVRKQLAKDLQNAKALAEERSQAAEAANRAKSVFLANMSHELRTPLTAIMGFARVMIRSRTLPKEHLENAGIITRSGEHLLTLINQVLDLSKIEAGRATLNSKGFDLHNLLNDIEDLFSMRAQEKHLKLLFERSPGLPRYIVTDEVKLRQVLINLLNNAVKFTKEGGIAVRVKCKESDFKLSEPTVCFEIEDTGPGIAPDESDKLFEAFLQTKSGQDSQEGTGLGLAISRKFVQLMGGDITVQSEVGKGSLFSFQIKAKITESSSINVREPTRRIIALEPGQPVYRLLIVDDKSDNRRLLVTLLAPLGFELKEAANGQEAVLTSEKWEPHLILMDMRMPVIDGYEATRQIKDTIKGQSIAIIAVTASAFEEERAMVLSAGCNDFVRKPFREEEIFQMMNKHLGIRFVWEEDVPEELKSVKKEIEKPLSMHLMENLSSELLSALEQAAIRGDSPAIELLIDEIRSIDGSLADALKDLSDNFEYDQILEFVGTRT
ncbi:MAG: transporter substrate-binding domain-containing protein [Desulfamplus sp.]|nr:transporter substrate-binding domain-containing protein [Desulfamplus sp.]